MRWERELASVRGTSPVHKQEGELNAKASLHANAECESVTLSTSLYANVELGKSTTGGGFETRERNRDLRKENISKVCTQK